MAVWKMTITSRVYGDFSVHDTAAFSYSWSFPSHDFVISLLCTNVICMKKLVVNKTKSHFSG